MDKKMKKSQKMYFGDLNEIVGNKKKTSFSNNKSTGIQNNT